MTTRKLLATGLVAVAGVLALTSDASAFGKRKKGGNCNSCSPAPTYSGGCGGCGMAGVGGPGGYAMVPEAMPATGVAQGAPSTTVPGVVTPASGTGGTVVTPGGTIVTPGGGSAVVPQQTVVPAGGYYQNGRYVVPAGGYYQNGVYVTPAGGYGTFDSGFGTGVIQGANGTSYYSPYGSTIGGTVGNYAGQQVGRGLFRRR